MEIKRKYKTKVKNFFINFSVLLIITMVCLSLAEIGFRIFQSDEVAPGYWPKENAVYIPEIKRNVYVNLDNLIKSTSEYSYSISTNNLGFRDFHDFEKSKNTFRIVALGTSTLFGNTVEADEIYINLLEKELEVETINLGLGGIGYDEMKYILTEYGMRYDPDLVLIEVEFGTFYTTSIFDDKKIFSEGKIRLDLWIYQNSKLINYFYWKTKTTPLGFKIINGLKLNSAGRSSNKFAGDLLQNKNLPEIHDSKKKVYKNLKEIKDILDERNIPLVMVYSPPHHQTSPEYLHRMAMEYNLPEDNLDVQVAENFYSAVAKQLNIPFFDPTEELTDYSKNKELRWKFDNHFNKEGHPFFASLLADFIKERDLTEK